MRQLKREVKIGNVTIGGKNPIAVQTMLNVPVEDIEGNVAQAKRCEAAGCTDLARDLSQRGRRQVHRAVKNAVNIPIVRTSTSTTRLPSPAPTWAWIRSASTGQHRRR